MYLNIIFYFREERVPAFQVPSDFNFQVIEQNDFREVSVEERLVVPRHTHTTHTSPWKLQVRITTIRDSKYAATRETVGIWNYSLLYAICIV